jgi:hypothetical protein
VPLCRHKVLSSNPVQPPPKKIFFEKVAQRKKCLPSMYKTLGSIPQHYEIKKKNGEEDKCH